MSMPINLSTVAVMFCFYRHDILPVATITRAIQGSNVDTFSGYLEEWGVPMRHDSYTQDIYSGSWRGFSNAYAWFHFRFISLNNRVT